MEFIPTNIPAENEYPKLVRDRIPEIIEKKGKKPQVEKISTDEEYLKYLLKKMIEESKELEYSLKQENMQKELADILELISAILKFKNWTIDDITAIQKEKREKNGGFDERLLLISKP